MNSGLIAVRYAKALLACAEERHEDKLLFDMMSTLCDSYMQYSELSAAFVNPTISNTQKKQLIIVAAGDVENALFVNFVELLLANRREEYLQRVALSYCELYQKDSKVCVGKVTTAKPLDEATDQRIRSFLQQWSGREVELKTKVNPEILGGFILDVGDERLDASIANQLRLIKKKLAH